MAATNDQINDTININKSIPYIAKIGTLHFFDDNKNMIDEINIQNILGKGGQGITYKATSKIYGNVAVKMIMKHKVNNIKHIINEINILSTISETCKEYLLCIHYSGEDTNNIYIVLEYIDGFNMADMVANPRFKFTEKSIASAICKIINGVQLLHTKYNIAHRDIKLDNIMFSRPNNFKLIDYGFSCVDETSIISSCPNNPGTLLYMAPEVILGNVNNKKAIDIWSLGIVIFLLILRLHNKIDRLQKYEDTVISYHKNKYVYPRDYLEKEIIQLLNDIDNPFKPILLSMINTSPLFRPTIDKIVDSIRELCS